MRVFIDTSALVKRSIVETESAALVIAMESFLAAGDVLFSSSLATVEVTRTLRARLESEPPQRVVELVDAALAGITTFALDAQVIGIAKRLGPSSLRSLDAIHLATAALMGADLVCAYDHRLLLTASELGFRTVSPA